MRRAALVVLAVVTTCVGSALAWTGWETVQTSVGPAPTLSAGSWTAPATEDQASAPAVVDQDDSVQRLLIPSLGVSAQLLPGAIRDHELVLPSDPSQLAVSSAGADPCTGDSGTVLVSGHVASHGTKGALWPLSTIKTEAVATISCPGAKPSVWRAVTAWESEKSSLDQGVFDTDGKRRMVVITCGGPVMPNGHYRDNVLVEFEPTN